MYKINNSDVIIPPRQYRICVYVHVYMNTSHILNQAISDRRYSVRVNVQTFDMLNM